MFCINIQLLAETYLARKAPW